MLFQATTRTFGIRTAALLAALLLAACGSSSSSTSDEVELGPPTPTIPRHQADSSPTRQTNSREKPRGEKPHPGPSRPEIKSWPIPFSGKRRQETAAYSTRHYGSSETRLDPKVIVEHYTVTPTAQAAFDTFAKDVPDVELHELPGLCSHFLIDRDGTVYQLVPLSTICRHTVGLNDVAIGIEHVGGSDSEVLSNRAQLASSLKLTTWLRCQYGIPIKDVIGHAESLSSPYHHEDVPALKNQTHSDFQPGAMDGYRRQLHPRGCRG